MQLAAHASPMPVVPYRMASLDLVALALLTVLAIGGLLRPYDAGWLISGDALYPLQLLQTPLLEYRPPAPNRLFPDVATHALVGTFVQDPFTQKLIVGSLLLILVSVAVGATKGVQAALLVLAILCAKGFGVLDSASHFSLPLLLVLIQATRTPTLRIIWLFVGVFSDPMLLLPLGIMYLRDDRKLSFSEATAMAFAFGFNTLYSEFSLSAVHVALLVPAWTAGFWLARRFGLLDAAAVALCVALVVAVWIGLIPARYGLPVAASIAILFFQTRWRMPSLRTALWPAAVALLFLATADMSRARSLQADFDCLGQTLATRGIDTVAIDHWSAKPLSFADAKAGRRTTISQIGFDDGRYHPWLAPHAYYGPRTPWGIRNRDTCAVIDSDARYCGQGKVAPVLSSEPICRIFDLYHYSTSLPLIAEPKPADKMAAIERNLEVYLKKARGISGRFIGTSGL